MRRVVATEAIALGALAVGVGGASAVAASAALVVLLFELPYRPPWGDLLWLCAIAFGLVSLLGWWQGRPVLRKSPLAGLRDAELPAGGGAPIR